MPADLSRPAALSRPLRSLFISDLHLGARGCRVDAILAFLRQTDAERIYLVGDILDFWHGGTVHWDHRHEAIIDLLGARAAAGVEVIYLYGNHDRAVADPDLNPLPRFTVAERMTHITADGTRLLVLHGDQCDGRLLKLHIMTRLGSRLDAMMRRIDGWLRRRLGKTDCEKSAIQAAISVVNRMLSAGDHVALRVSRLAQDSGHEGVICGHFHKPALRTEAGFTYANCGDWMDSLTALVETHDGCLRLARFEPDPAPAAAPAPHWKELPA